MVLRSGIRGRLLFKFEFGQVRGIEGNAKTKRNRIMNQKTGLKIGGLAALTVLVLWGIWTLVGWSYLNAHAGYVNMAKAQQKNLEVVYDSMWKVISGKAKVSEKYSKDFREAYPAIMAGRYGGAGDGSMMKWITEHNPTYDAGILKSVANSIEELRGQFAFEQ